MLGISVLKPGVRSTGNAARVVFEHVNAINAAILCTKDDNDVNHRFVPARFEIYEGTADVIVSRKAPFELGLSN